MKSNLSPESIARTSASGSSAPVTNGYSSSVPLSVYRELAAELQATKAKLDAVKLQNQTLTQHNQELRQRVDQVYESVSSLRQAFGTTSERSPAPSEPTQVTDDITAELKRALTMQPPSSTPKSTSKPETEDNSSPTIKLPFSDDDAVSPNALFLEKNAESSLDFNSKSSGGMSSLWVTIVLIVVIVTAFAGGFMFIWVLQQNNNR
jgi:hypothetical protein